VAIFIQCGFFVKVTKGELPPIPQHLKNETKDFIQQCLRGPKVQNFSSSHLLCMNKVRQLLKNNMTKNFVSMFLKCYYHLHPLVEFERGVVDQRVD
jgi:hypothetical protein